MKLRSRDLLFREKGSMDDFRGPGGEPRSPWHALGHPPAPFWDPFSKQKHIFSTLFFWTVLCIFFYVFSWFWKPFWELLRIIFDNFLKTAILWNIAPRLSESMIFKVREGLETRFVVMFWYLVSALALESFFLDFRSILGFILSPKIDQKRDRFRDRF